MLTLLYNALSSTVVLYFHIWINFYICNSTFGHKVAHLTRSYSNDQVKELSIFLLWFYLQDAREDLLQIVFHLSGWVSHIRSRPGPFSPPFPENIREILCFIFIVLHFWLQRKQWQHLFSVRKLFLNSSFFYQQRVTHCKRRPQFTKMVVTITVLVMGETENA